MPGASLGEPDPSDIRRSGCPVPQGDAFSSWGGPGRRTHPNEFGGKTSAELNIDALLMYDLGRHVGAQPKTLRAGLEYQYWRNKFGNPKEVDGSLAKTPMVRVEYHF